MNIFSSNAIGIFIILFLPGFLSIKIYKLITADEKYDFTKNLYEIIGFSLINFVIFSVPILYMVKNNWFINNPILFFISGFFILILGPLGWPILLNKILANKWIKGHVISSSKSAWDFFFSKRVGSWIIVTLKDGKKIAGKFNKNSFASPYPTKETIYIEELWEIDSNNFFLDPIPRTNGAIIISDEISIIEFYK